MKKRFLLSLWVLVLLHVGRAAASACGCPTIASLEQETQWRIDKAKVVFTGTVIEIKGKHVPFLTTFKVDQSWKMDLPEEIKLIGDGSTCEMFFQLGYKYFVIAHEKDGGLSTTSCARNARLEKASVQLGLLGKGRPPLKSSRKPTR